MNKKIRIVFDGPPSHESGRFIEVENEHGEGMSFGEWKQEGEFWYLEFPNPARCEAIIHDLIETMKKPAIRGAKTTLQMCKFLDVWISDLEDALRGEP